MPKPPMKTSAKPTMAWTTKVMQLPLDGQRVTMSVQVFGPLILFADGGRGATADSTFNARGKRWLLAVTAFVTNQSHYQVCRLTNERDAKRVAERLMVDCGEPFRLSTRQDCLEALPAWVALWCRACESQDRWLEPVDFQGKT